MALKDKFKSILGLHEDPYLSEYYDGEEDATELPRETDDPEATQEGRAAWNKEESTMNTTSGAGLKPKLVIHEPITYEDGPKILDDIKNRKIVVIDFETLDVDKKKQIFEFVNGGIYSMEAQIRKVTKDIFVVAPKGVDVEGKQLEPYAVKADYNL